MNEINFAIAATKINPLYDSTGVDLIYTEELEPGVYGETHWVEWVDDAEVNDDTGEGKSRADQILHERGLWRTGPWEDTNDEYYIAPVETR